MAAPGTLGAGMMLLGLIPAGSISFSRHGFEIRAGATCDFPAPGLILLDIPAAAAASIMNIQTGN